MGWAVGPANPTRTPRKCANTFSIYQKSAFDLNRANAFIANRWPELRAQRCRNHREVLQNEIKAYFRVSLSGESLRMMMNQITSDKARAEARAPAAPVASPQADTLPDTSSGGVDATLEFDLTAPVDVRRASADEAAMFHAHFPAGEKSAPFPQASDATPSGALKPALGSESEPPFCHQTHEDVEVVAHPGLREWTFRWADKVMHGDFIL